MPADLRPPHGGLLVANLIAQIAFGLLALTVCLPSMQEWGTLFGTDQARVQLTFSAFVLPYGAMQLLYGPLSDRLGRRRVLVAGLALAVLGSAAAGAISWGALARFAQPRRGDGNGRRFQTACCRSRFARRASATAEA